MAFVGIVLLAFVLIYTYVDCKMERLMASTLAAYRVAPSRYCLKRGGGSLPMGAVAFRDLLAEAEPDSYLCGDRRCTPSFCVTYDPVDATPTHGVPTTPSAFANGGKWRQP